MDKSYKKCILSFIMLLLISTNAVAKHGTTGFNLVVDPKSSFHQDNLNVRSFSFNFECAKHGAAEEQRTLIYKGETNDGFPIFNSYKNTICRLSGKNITRHTLKKIHLHSINAMTGEIDKTLTVHSCVKFCNVHRCFSRCPYMRSSGEIKCKVDANIERQLSLPPGDN